MLFVAGAAISAGIMIGPMIATALSGNGDRLQSFPQEEVVTMVNPRFTGRNIAGEAFELVARTATRRYDDPNVIDLEFPKLTNEAGTVITSKLGVYNQTAQFLDLFEDVRVRDKDGYEFTTEVARVFVNEGRVEGIEPLRGSGPLGDVRADTYEILDDGNQIVMRGCVEMLIFPGGRERPENQITETSEGSTNEKDNCGRPASPFDNNASPWPDLQ